MQNAQPPQKSLAEWEHPTPDGLTETYLIYPAPLSPAELHHLLDETPIESFKKYLVHPSRYDATQYAGKKDTIVKIFFRPPAKAGGKRTLVKTEMERRSLQDSPLNAPPRTSAPRHRSPVYALPVLDRFLVYAPFQNRVFLCTEQERETIRRSSTPVPPPSDSNTAKEALIMNAVKGADVFDRPPLKPCSSSSLVRPLFLGIVLTRKCNLSCRYCNFGGSHKPGKKIPPGMVARAIDWMTAHTRTLGEQNVAIHFFGGEPFIETEIVKFTVRHALSSAAQHGLRVHFEASTNGVIAPSFARYIGEHFQAIVLSFDGPSEIHDFQRPVKPPLGSFAQVVQTAHILRQSQIELCFRVCVTQLNVRYLAEITQWLCAQFNPAMINFETLQPTPESALAGLRPPDPYEFTRQFLNALNVSQSQKVQVVYAAGLSPMPRYSFCPLGNDALILAPDGRIHGCYLLPEDGIKRGLDLTLGQVTPKGGELDLAKAVKLRERIQHKPRCLRCFCRWTCAGGCHVNQTYPGCSMDYSNFCIQTRLVTMSMLLAKLEGGMDIMERMLAHSSALTKLGDNAYDPML